MELSGRMLAMRVAVLLLSIAAVQGACDEQTSQKTCVNDADGCLWQVTADTSGDQSSECVSCSTYDDDAWLCVSPCTYHESSGQCSISSPASMPTAAPVSTTADTGVLAMTLRLEMPTYILSDDQMDAVDSILAEVMAAQTATSVDSDSVDAETCGYAPLCGTANNMITVLPTNSDEIDITFSSMDPCCPARDTAPVEDCEIVNLEGEACRVAGIQVPVCSDLTNPTQACLALSENPDQASLTISSLTYTDGGATGGCCETCTCYGDPNCVSFNGTEASWRVCDGRDTTTKNCKITQSACKSVEDTNGAACLWKPSTWESTWQSGSKCQPAADGEPSWLLMYKADDFEFWVRQEERGVIREAMMYTSDANFSLDATSCIEETSLSSSWTLEGSSSWPSYTANWVRKDSNETFDVVWYIVDGSTNIQVSIACTGTVDPSDANKVLSKQTYGNYRINIDAIIEPLESWNTTRSNLDGFCYTSSLLGNNASQTEIAALQAHREIEAACKAKGIVYDTDEAREFARTICTSYTTNQSVQICFAFFCKNYASLAQSSIDAETCVDYFEALDVTNGFCRVAYSSDALISKCINEINEFGYSEIVAEFLNNVGAETTTCISSLENLTTSLTSCQEGITLQYQATAGDDDSWTDYAAFPASRGLCDQELQVPYIGNEVLFTHPIRFQQCSRDSSCGVVEQCNWIDGVSMDLSFSLPQQVNSVTTSPSAYSCSDYCAEDVTMETGVDIDSDVCTTEITFTSSDIDASSMCADCDFTGEESIRESGDGYYVSLGDSCDLADSDTTGLEEACAQICFLLLDADCDAWILKGGDCFLYSCENDTATFVDGSSVGGGVCRVARGVATPAPSQMPTLVPTASPFPTSTDSPISTSGCVQSVCPSDVETPEVQTSIVIDETVCAHDIMFSASDLDSSDFCYSCDFSSDNILQTSDGNGNYIDMTAACDLTTDDTDDLDAVCAHVCAQFDGCDAWVIAGGNCFIFACDNDEASFTSGSYRGAAACPGTTTCVQSVCPAGDDTPEVQTSIVINETVCAHDITFSASDLNASDFCYSCDFSSDNILQTSDGNGNYIDMTAACDLTTDDTDDLDAVCAHVCAQFDGCDAWVIAGGNCFIFACDNDEASFTSGSYRGAAACPGTTTCVQSVCPAGDDTPEVQTSIVIDETVCAHDITFSASDLNASDFCYSCDFSSDNILQTSDGNGNYIDMTAACDLTTDDTDDLDAVCAHVCAQFDGCDAWVIAGGNCFIFACDNDEASFTSGSYRGAAACPKTTTCVQSVCPAGDDTPEVQTSIVIDESVCAHDITFSASDLNASDFCYSCDFSSDNILQTSDGNGNYIDMTAACDLTTDDTDDLDAVCAHACAQFDACDAWVIAGGNCFIFACDNDVSFASGSYRGAAACPSSPTTAPTLLPTMAPTLTPTETPTRSPSGSPTLLPTMAPTLTPTETPTRSPSGSPTKAPTSRPTKSPTRSPTQAPTHSPTQAPTHSPTQAPTHSPTQAPTHSPTQAPTRSPTQAPTRSPTKSPTSAPTQTPTTQSFGWTRRLDEEEDGINVKLITSVEDSSTVPRRALSRRGFAAAASRKTALNPSGALTPRMTRRELTPGMTEFYITSYLMYTDASSAESARDDTANYYGNTMEVLREAFASSSAFSDYSDTLNVTGVTTSLNYDYYILRFDVPYVASEHDAEDFLAGICFVVQRTVYRTKSKHKMGTLKCDVNLFNFTSYAESDSDLAIHFRIESSKVSAGEFQTLFARSSTRTTFNNVIEQCGSNSVEECDVSAITNLVSTLKASFASSDPDEDGSSGGLSSAGIAVVVVALVAAVVVAVGAVVWRRRRIQKRELSMSHYEVGPKHGLFFDEDEDSRA